jgi:hypothetical protein
MSTQFSTQALTTDHEYNESQRQVMNDTPIKISTVVVHEFGMGDVEDPDLYAAEPLLAWQHSEAGEWVMKHSVDQPQWHRQVDHMSYGYQYCITARLTEQNEIFFKLKFK